MKATDLMIGDIVRFDDKIMKVAEIYGDTRIPLSYSCRLIDEYGSYTTGVVFPVPLTREILVANGFKGKEVMEYRFEEDGETYNLYLKEMFNKNGEQDAWGTNVGGVLPSIVTYVHELQHILRLAGLREKANSFRIE